MSQKQSRELAEGEVLVLPFLLFPLPSLLRSLPVFPHLSPFSPSLSIFISLCLSPSVPIISPSLPVSPHLSPSLPVSLHLISPPGVCLRSTSQSGSFDPGAAPDTTDLSSLHKSALDFQKALVSISVSSLPPSLARCSPPAHTRGHDYAPPPGMCTGQLASPESLLCSRPSASPAPDSAAAAPAPARHLLSSQVLGQQRSWSSCLPGQPGSAPGCGTSWGPGSLPSLDFVILPHRGPALCLNLDSLFRNKEVRCVLTVS